MRLVPVSNPPNRFSAYELEYLEAVPTIDYEVYEDHSRQILAENESPDVGFRYSVNPYRGCMHACAYCYARPWHEYLGFGAGTDFDRRIVVKPRAPDLLRQALERPSWRGETIAFSGVTDCYQPLEANLRLTRGCLEVCAEYRNPVGIVTKSPLVERDLDVLVRLAREAKLSVAVSIPLWNPDHARALEPLVAPPDRRMKTIERLRREGIEAGVLVAPLIPGLGEQDLGGLLEAARSAGASFASYLLLRLNGSVAPVFEERLRAALPLSADRILERTREVHGGRPSDSRFGKRHRGQGRYAEAIEQLFRGHARRLGLAHTGANQEESRASTFRRPLRSGAQLALL